MDYFATAYTIHFDDTMSYGSHHFLTSFKFQCACREAFLFGDRIYDLPGVPEALDGIHLLTADAYARNLNPAVLGDRVAILLTIEDWQRVSTRFCYRVIDAHGTPSHLRRFLQSLICADAHTGRPIPLPSPLWDAMEECEESKNPRDRNRFAKRCSPAGASLNLYSATWNGTTARHYLADRYPHPKVIAAIRRDH